MIEARRISQSVTQGFIQITINGKELVTFGDDKKLIDGEWKSTHENLGDSLCAAFWHPLDRLYRYSDKAKELFKE